MTSQIYFENASLWWVLLLPLALLLAHISAYLYRRRVVSAFSGRSLIPLMLFGVSRARAFASSALFFLALEAFGVAIMRPKYGLRDTNVRGLGIDVAIVLDASRSMKTPDLVPDRFTRASVEIGRLLDNMRGNRVALVPFAGLAFIQSPLTLDYEVIKQYIASLSVLDMPVPGTNIGRALQVAASALGVDKPEAASSTNKAIILFSDGENHEGEPEKVADFLAQRGVKVFTVGVGTPAGQPVPILNEKGQVIGTQREKDGTTPVISKLNEDLLRKVAEKTGGKYFALTEGSTVAEDLQKALSALEKSEYQVRLLKLLEERFQIPLAIGLVMIGVAFLLLGGGVRPKHTALLVFFLLCQGKAAFARGFFERADPKAREAIEAAREGRSGDAIKALEEVAKELPGRPDVLYNLALARDGAEQYDEAIKACDEALSALALGKALHPDWPSRARMLHAKGTILLHKAKKMRDQGKSLRETLPLYRQALEVFTEALVLDPSSEETRKNLEICALSAFPPCSKMDDKYEPNDTLSEAQFLTPDPNTQQVKEELTLCPDNHDFFKLPLRRGETMIARTLEQGGEERPSSVTISLLDTSGKVLRPPTGSLHFRAEDGMTVVLDLSGPKSDDGLPYILEVRLIPPCPAGDDSLEDNDSQLEAREVQDGETAGRICPFDDDWFKYVEKKDTAREVRLSVPQGEGPLELEVFHADGAPLDIRREEGEEGVTFTATLPKATEDATFTIRVFGGGNEGFYNLSIHEPKGGDKGQREQKKEGGSQTMRDLLEAIDKNEENLEAKEAERQFMYRDYVPEKDW